MEILGYLALGAAVLVGVFWAGRDLRAAWQRHKRRKEESFEVVHADQKSMQSAVTDAQEKRYHPVKSDPEAATPHALDAEGGKWFAHDNAGLVLLSGEDGVVQAQFTASAAVDLAEQIAEAALNCADVRVKKH